MQPSAASGIAGLYDRLGDVELTFTGPIMAACGLVPSEVYVRVGEEHIPCVLYASSMRRARLVAEMNDRASATLARAKNLLSLRLAFRRSGEPSPVGFFISARAESFAEYNAGKPRVKFVTLAFLQRPPDPFVEIVGKLLETRTAASGRKEERIVVTPESAEAMGLSSRESCMGANGIMHRCILRDLSLGGAKVLTAAPSAPQGGGAVVLKLARCELKEETTLTGEITRVERVQDHSDLVEVSIRYTVEPPASYTQKIRSYLQSTGRGTAAPHLAGGNATLRAESE